MSVWIEKAKALEHYNVWARNQLHETDPKSDCFADAFLQGRKMIAKSKWSPRQKPSICLPSMQPDQKEKDLILLMQQLDCSPKERHPHDPWDHWDLWELQHCRPQDCWGPCPIMHAPPWLPVHGRAPVTITWRLVSWLTYFVHKPQISLHSWGVFHFTAICRLFQSWSPWLSGMIFPSDLTLETMDMSDN